MEPLPNARAPVVKEGLLSKLGGGAGGHANWKDRYCVLSDHLYYYESKSDYEKKKAPVGRVVLCAYYCTRAADSGPASGDAAFEFTIHAFPKGMTLRARSHGEVDAWLAALMKPLADANVPYNGWKRRGGAAAAGAGGR